MSTESAANRRALFPASFDPLTNGHLDLIHRAQMLFDEVVVALAVNVTKSGTFSESERLEMLEAVVGDYPRVRVESFEGLGEEKDTGPGVVKAKKFYGWSLTTARGESLIFAKVSQHVEGKLRDLSRRTVVDFQGLYFLSLYTKVLEKVGPGYESAILDDMLLSIARQRDASASVETPEQDLDLGGREVLHFIDRNMAESQGTVALGAERAYS